MKDKIIELIKGDITTREVDAIIHAAKKTLLGGVGADGANEIYWRVLDL
jgi:O-acetyl-ADP-ribose deacetylase